MLIGLLYALISALCFGISNAWWKKAVSGDDFSRVVFYRGVLAVSLFALVWILLDATESRSLLIRAERAPVRAYLLTISLCLACSLGLLFFLSSLNYAPVSISVPLSSVNIFSILTAVIILGESFRPVYFLSFLLAGTGAWFLRSSPTPQKAQWHRGHGYALLAALFWGVTYALFWYPARWLGAVPLAFILESSVMAGALVWNLLQARPACKVYRIPAAGFFRHYSFLAVLLVGGTLFYNLAIQLTDVLVLNLTGNFSLVTSVLLGYWMLKERIGKRQWYGILLLITSLLITQLF